MAEEAAAQKKLTQYDGVLLRLVGTKDQAFSQVACKLLPIILKEFLGGLGDGAFCRQTNRRAFRREIHIGLYQDRLRKALDK